jgi:hypothetical protein
MFRYSIRRKGSRRYTALPLVESEKRSGLLHWVDREARTSRLGVLLVRLS